MFLQPIADSLDTYFQELDKVHNPTAIDPLDIVKTRELLDYFCVLENDSIHEREQYEDSKESVVRTLFAGFLYAVKLVSDHWGL
jgi:hypothetical protein